MSKEHQNVANAMENDRFKLQNVANTVEMVVFSSKNPQIAKKTDKRGNQEKTKWKKHTSPNNSGANQKSRSFFFGHVVTMTDVRIVHH